MATGLRPRPPYHCGERRPGAEGSGDRHMSHPIRILHLRTSNFVGGPDRQLLRSGDYEREGPLELIFGTLVGETEGRDFSRAVQHRGLQLLALPADTVWDIGAFSRLAR